MRNPILCPLCHKTSVKHSRFTRKDTGETIQRYKCSACHKTFKDPRHYTDPFFKSMRTNPNVFIEAINRFSKAESIRSIARELHIRPNTIINWITKVKREQLLFRTFLKTKGNYSPSQIDELIDKFFGVLNG